MRFSTFAYIILLASLTPQLNIIITPDSQVKSYKMDQDNPFSQSSPWLMGILLPKYTQNISCLKLKIIHNIFTINQLMDGGGFFCPN